MEDHRGARRSPWAVWVRGLTFRHGERYTWRDGQKGWGLQHDWEFFDRMTPDQALEVRDAYRVQLADSLRRWAELAAGDITRFNRMLVERGLPPIVS